MSEWRYIGSMAAPAAAVGSLSRSITIEICSGAGSSQCVRAAELYVRCKRSLSSPALVPSVYTGIAVCLPVIYDPLRLAIAHRFLQTRITRPSFGPIIGLSLCSRCQPRSQSGTAVNGESTARSAFWISDTRYARARRKYTLDVHTRSAEVSCQ